MRKIMHVYYFRCKDVSRENNENATTAWIGVVFAKTMIDLFWQIDEHADPYNVEVKKVDCSGSIFVCEKFNPKDEELSDFEYSNVEVSETIPSWTYETNGWKTIDWGKYVEKRFSKK